MKQIWLTGFAVLALSASAHAHSHNRLPKSMQGNWCGPGATKFAHYKRGHCDEHLHVRPTASTIIPCRSKAGVTYAT